MQSNHDPPINHHHAKCDLKYRGLASQPNSCQLTLVCPRQAWSVDSADGIREVYDEFVAKDGPVLLEIKVRMF